MNAAISPPSDESRGRFIGLLVDVGWIGFVWASLLVALDTWSAYARMPGSSPVASLAGFAVFGAGALLSVLWPLGYVRALLRQWATSSAPRRAFIGALDGALIAYLVCVLEKYVTISQRTVLVVGALLVVGTAVAFAIAPHFPRLRILACAALTVVALVLESRLPLRENRWVHLGLDLIAAGGFVGLLTPWLSVVPRWAKYGACATGVVLVLSAPAIVRGSMATRAILYGPSTHGRVHTAALGPWFDPPPTTANWSGFIPCSGKHRPGCGGFAANAPSTLTGAAKGADILLLSIDAMRWDHAHAMRGLFKEMGPHVTFSRAVSPAPRTAHSFGSVLRGRPLRQVPFARGGRHSGVAEHATKTLGSVFNANGYRAFNAPTHHYLSKSERISRGFLQLIPPSFRDRFKGPVFRRIPLKHATAQLLGAARDTQGPMLGWVHAMDTHAPYTWKDGSGPESPKGQRHAARNVDKTLARFVRDFRAARQGRPLIIVVFGDHGEEFKEHGGRYHSATIYAEQVRVMFAISAPGLNAQRIDAPVSTTAIAATLFDLVGVPRPCTFTVPSLLSCIERGESCPQIAVSELVPFHSTNELLAGYTGPRYRLLYDRKHEITRLFDSSSDPYEQRDAAHRKGAELTKMELAAREWDNQFCVESTPAERVQSSPTK